MDAPFTSIPFAPEKQSPLLFLCDHASNAVPPPYGDLGLSKTLFQTHIAYDIGAADVATSLAKAYGAAALLGGVSRLLIDLNRGPGDPTLVMKLSDGSIIPGNRGADDAEVAKRLQQFHAPYHAAIREQMGRIGKKVILISIHSFTPSWKSVARPWEVGVLYGRDARLAVPLMRQLAMAGFTVGDNEPYTGALEGDTLDTHGTKTGHANVLIEIRQDFLGEGDKVKAMAARLKPLLDASLKEMSLAEMER
ncbi:MAG TPA: N-formylglutamate amidohydrolase [Rhizomicrobium sp.]|jgi:predicted N-formylglutamate amidohydrolase|nr:N-formylglutamate amidohydrolase [Rhizomicrobium sp.]